VLAKEVLVAQDRTDHMMSRERDPLCAMLIPPRSSTTSNITQVAATSNTSLNTAFTWSTDDWSPAINDAGSESESPPSSLVLSASSP
jgi:hypothetical protein